VHDYEGSDTGDDKIHNAPMRTVLRLIQQEWSVLVPFRNDKALFWAQVIDMALAAKGASSTRWAYGVGHGHVCLTDYLKVMQR
jgi:hypothetical protein